MQYIEFNSVKSFIVWLLDNENFEVFDNYGRRWKYESYNFYFKDIGADDVYVKGLECLHLFGTRLAYRQIKAKIVS